MAMIERLKMEGAGRQSGKWLTRLPKLTKEAAFLGATII